MSHALLDMGPAVLLGGLSTLLGLLPLAGTTSDIFQTFFKLMAGTIGFGLAAGLLLVPSVMAFIAPKAIIIEMDNREQL